MRGGNLRHASHNVVLLRGLTGLCEQSSSVGHLSPGKREAGQKDLTGNGVLHCMTRLPRQMEALSPVLLGGLQIVPFVEDTGQAQMRFAEMRKWLIPC